MPDEIEQIQQAIAALEAQREILGEQVLATALAPLRQRLEQLQMQSIGEQRKVVTLLFADLAGFTAMSEKMDPEDVRDVTDAYFKCWTEAIEAHRGTVEKFIGDAVMAVFGLKAASEQDPENAVRAALAMRDALEELNGELEHEQQLRLTMRVGIHTGPVVVSLLGERKGQDFVVVGDTVNLASRLQSAAPEGGILISADTYRYVRGVFDVEALEPVSVKGKSEPVPVVLVQQAKPRSFRHANQDIAGGVAKLVGRQAEMQLLQDVYRACLSDGSVHGVTLVGEPGIGKSRLVFELDDWLEIQPGGYFYFQGRANSGTLNISYALLRDMFAFRCQIQDSDLPAVVRSKLEQEIKTAAGDGETVSLKAYYLGRLLGFELGENLAANATASVDARQIQDQGMLALTEYLRLLSRKDPVVLLLEDLHWADDSSLGAIEQLVGILSNAPILLVCTARPELFERQPGWGKALPNWSRLDMQPLSPDESQLLVGEILKKVTELPEKLNQLVVQNTEGNPFYIEELIKMMIDEGLIQIQDEVWQVQADRLEKTYLPPTLTEVLQSRFDSLSPGEKSVLQQAAVVGRTFWDKAVEFIDQAGSPALQSRTNVAEMLGGLNRREMVYRRESAAFEDTREYSFKHNLLRDVTYESLLKRYRRAYHAYTARWLAQVTQRSQREGEYAALIGEHFERSGELETAADWYGQAARRAAAQYANTEAVLLFTRTLDLTPPEQVEKRFGALSGREKVFELQGAREQQKQDLDALAELIASELIVSDGDAVNVSQWQAQLEIGWSSYYDQLGDYQPAQLHARQAIELALNFNDIELQARGYIAWGWADWHYGDFIQASEHFRQANTLAETVGMRELQADSQRSLGVIAELTGDYPQAKRELAQALDTYRKNNNLRGEALTLNSLGVVYYHQLEIEASRGYFEESLRLKSLMGDRYGEGVSLCNLGHIAVSQFDLSGAHRFYQQSLEVCQTIQNLEGEEAAIIGLGYVASRAGRLVEAREYYQQALLIGGQIGDKQGVSDSLSSLGEAELRAGDAESAREHCKQAIAIAQEIGAPHEEGLGWYHLGNACLSLGQLDEAQAAFERSGELHRALEQVDLDIDNQAGLAAIAFRRGDLQLASRLAAEVLRALPQAAQEGIEALLDYWTIYQVFQAIGDATAGICLESAIALLEDQAGKINDEGMRRSFFRDVQVNRDLLAAWKKYSGREKDWRI
jgi:class 3 adenylate cyclase/tetratricopeptide (TPR) repeat protein